MDSHSPALSEQIAGLRRAVQAAPAAAWLPATLHALIIACFARLFTRLEQMLQLWQSGDLVIPQIPPRTTTKSAHRRSPSAATFRQSRRCARQTATPARPRARHPRAIRRTAAIPPSATRQRPRPARDPPAPCPPSRVTPARSYNYDIETIYLWPETPFLLKS